MKLNRNLTVIILFTVGIVSLFCEPADSSAWLANLLLSKTIAAACFYALHRIHKYSC